MFFHIFLISFLTWSMSRCEPPVNSYLPPSSGSSSPSPQYGPPGFGRSGASSGPGRVNGGPNQQSSFQNGGKSGAPSNQYGPPSSDQNPRSGSSNFGGSNKGGIGQNQAISQPNSQFGAPNQFGGSHGGPSERLISGSPGFGQSTSNRNQRPETSYGPPPTGDFQSTNGGSSGRYSNNPQQGRQGDYNSSPTGSGSQSDSPSALYGSPGFGSNGDGPRSGQLRNQNGNFDGQDSNGPAKYQFSYEVDDEQTGTKFGHSEQRDGDLATGEYNVLLPDGRKQVVEYEADLEGYKPQIRYEGSASGQGFSQGRTNGFTGGDSNNGFRPQNGSPARYQEASSFGSADASQGEGYPRGGPGGSGTNGSGGNGFGSSGFGSSGAGSVNGRGGQNPSQTGANGGYPSGGPQNGGSFTQSLPQSGGSNGYPNGSSQSGGSFTQSSPHSGGSGGYPSGGSKNGGGFSNGGEEGYPSGGPNGVRGSGY